MQASFLWELAESLGASVPDEEKWTAIRMHRAGLLAGCDWTQLPDAPLTLEEKQAWAAYRQALRNIPQDYDDPDQVVFPETP
jgi:hypothetical protein